MEPDGVVVILIQKLMVKEARIRLLGLATENPGTRTYSLDELNFNALYFFSQKLIKNNVLHLNPKRVNT